MIFTATCRIWEPFPIDGELSKDSTIRLVTAFSGSKAYPFRNSEYHKHATIDVSLGPEKSARIDIGSRPWIRRFWEIHVRCNLEFPGSKKFFLTHPDGRRADHDYHTLRDVWRHFMPDEMRVFVKSYLLCLQLTFPGILIGETKYTAGAHRIVRSETMASSLRESVNFVQEIGIELNCQLPMDDVVNWVFAQNGIFDGYSDTPASRCLAYFSRVFSTSERTDELSEFVWALAAIEALLVEQGRSSIGQLKAKVGALFNSHANLDQILRAVEKMYEYRSKMIHGNRQLKSYFRIDETDTDKRFYEEYDSIRFALGLCFALLQKLIAHQSRQFSFKTVLA